MSAPGAADLTARQAEIFKFIQRFIEDTGMPPTRAEMARELGFRSANAADSCLVRPGVSGFSKRVAHH
jgi:SOS-response transcriptional repressor LexA